MRNYLIEVEDFIDLLQKPIDALSKIRILDSTL
jgi:hypothetical protein